MQVFFVISTRPRTADDMRDLLFAWSSKDLVRVSVLLEQLINEWNEQHRLSPEVAASLHVMEANSR